MTKLALALVLAMFVCVAYAGQHGWGHEAKHEDHGWGWSYPKYKYSYGVNDKHTWDQKHASEWRDGDKVGGEYSLKEPDGTWRTVTYTADKGGFKAHVHRSGWGHGGSSNGGGGHGGWKADHGWKA